MIQGPNGLFVNATVDTFSAVAVPEPSAAIIVLSALAVLGGLRLVRGLVLVCLKYCSESDGVSE